MTDSIEDLRESGKKIRRLLDESMGGVRQLGETLSSRDEEIKQLRKALELIADEQKSYKGHGDFDILPALTAEEAQALARSTLVATDREKNPCT